MTQRYDTYKDSGVQWLGEIPGHWGCVPLKYFIETKSGTAINVKELDDRGTYPVYGGGSQIGFCNKYNCEETEIIVGRVGAKCGCVTFPNKKVWATDNALIIKTHLYPRFTAFVLVAADLNRLNAANAQPLITGTKIKHVRIALPPLSEQRSIVSFLDAKCGKIDEWVTKKQKEVEHLQELKQRVIADAVTRGLNPHVKMKATNIPWLKEIPEHWECIRLTTCILSSVVGSWGVDEKKDGTDILCLRVADFDYNKGIIKEDKLTYRNYEGKLSEEKFFRDGDLLLEKSGGGAIYPVGRVVRFSLNGRIATCSNFIQKLTPNSEIVSSDYLYFWFKMIYSLKINGMYFNQTTGIQNLKVNEYLKQMIYLPPLSEQKQIVSYLDAKCSKIDKLIANITKEIECIKEYKQRLISDVVTGQIKVC